MEEKELTKLQLGDEVWIPEKRPLFERRNFGISEKNILIEELHAWSDGEVTATSLLDGHGPDYWTSMKYRFTGAWKSSESWKMFWTFVPWCGSTGFVDRVD